MPRSPQWMDLYQIWFRVSSRGRNQLCGILLQSAHGFRFCEGSNFAISHWLGRSPLTQCWRYRAACDNNNNVVVVYVVVVLSSSSSTLSSSPELKYKYRFISTNPQDTEELGQLQYCRQDGRPFFKKIFTIIIIIITSPRWQRTMYGFGCLVMFVALFVTLSWRFNLAPSRENGLSYRHDTSRIDG